MRIGILEAGEVPEELEPRHGSYPAQFRALLGPAAPELGFADYRVCRGRLPDSPEECDAWLVTGSKHGVYDDLPWIAPLRDFLVRARAAARPIVGICFGHQLLAEALGGAAAKSERGWGVGITGYETLGRPGWMAEAPANVSLHAFHQDQVHRLPADATVLARSPHCPYAMLAYGDPERPDAISIQPHPEFTNPYAVDLIERRAGLFSQDLAGRALESYRGPHQGDVFARWTAAYLNRAVRSRRAA